MTTTLAHNSLRDDRAGMNDAGVRCLHATSEAERPGLYALPLGATQNSYALDRIHTEIHKLLSSSTSTERGNVMNLGASVTPLSSESSMCLAATGKSSTGLSQGSVNATAKPANENSVARVEADETEDKDLQYIHDWLTSSSVRELPTCSGARSNPQPQSQILDSKEEVHPESVPSHSLPSSRSTSLSTGECVAKESLTTKDEDEDEDDSKELAYEALRSELDRARAELKDLTTESSSRVQKLEGDILSLVRTMSSQETELVALRAERDARKESETSWQKNLRELKENLDASHAFQSEHLLRLEGMIQTLCSMEGTSEPEMKKDEKDGVDVNKLIMALAEARDTAEADRDTWRDLLDESNDEVSALEIKLEAFEEAEKIKLLEGLRECRKDMQSQLELMSREVGDLKATNDKIRRELKEGWNERYISVKKELDAANQALQAAEDKDEYNREAIENFSRREKKERERALSELNELRMQLEKACGENDKLVSSDCAKQVEITRLTLSELSLQGEIRRKDRELEETKSHLQSVLSEQTQRRKTIGHQAKRIRELEAICGASPSRSEIGSAGNVRVLVQDDASKDVDSDTKSCNLTPTDRFDGDSPLLRDEASMLLWDIPGSYQSTPPASKISQSRRFFTS